MATWNYELQHLTLEEINKASERFLMGWHDTIADGHSFRVKGLNARRQKFGLRPLTKEWSAEYRIDYIRSHYTKDEIIRVLSDYLSNHRVADTRWTGIELFGCRFGRDYARIFKQLVGSAEWRKMSERFRFKKSLDTQMKLYGGIGVAGKETYDKMISTKMKAVEDEMQKYHDGGNLNDAVFASTLERKAFYLLVDRFGRKDVFYQYGIHPYDARYPFPCDFYIKSLDLFIEMNAHYNHGGHWFDINNHDDVLRCEHIKANGKPKDIKGLKIWCETDLQKREKAKTSKIKYLVFWCGRYNHRDVKGDKKRHYEARLEDFMEWMIKYDCNYESYIKDHPECTY